MATLVTRQFEMIDVNTKEPEQTIYNLRTNTKQSQSFGMQKKTSNDNDSIDKLFFFRIAGVHRLHTCIHT